MNTQQLKTFVQVAENLNFARAAESLNITQSAVSRQIHALEEELDTKLLHRTTRTVRLTPAGISFLDDAKQIIERLKYATAKIQHHTAAAMQVVSIGCGSEAHLDFLNGILDSCLKEMPAFHPFLRIISHRSLLNLFYQGELDLLIGFQSDIPLKGNVVYDELLHIPLCCVFPRGHAYAGKNEITEQDLLSERLVFCNSYALPAGALEYQNRITGYLPPESVYFCDNYQAALTLVRTGYGYCILSQSRFPDEQLCYIPLAGTDPLSYGIFYKKGVDNPPLKKFISIAKRSVKEDFLS